VKTDLPLYLEERRNTLNSTRRTFHDHRTNCLGGVEVMIVVASSYKIHKRIPYDNRIKVWGE
jgi:hypothetical protein